MSTQLVLPKDDSKLSDTVRCIRKFHTVMYEAGRGWSPHTNGPLSLARIALKQEPGVVATSDETIAAIRAASGAQSANVIDWIGNVILAVDFEEHKLADAVISAALDQNIALTLSTVFRQEFKGGETYSRDIAEAKAIDHVIDRYDMLNDDPKGTTDFEAFLQLREQVVYMYICGTFQSYSYLCAEPCAWSSDRGKKFARVARKCFARHDLPGSRREQPCRQREMRALGEQIGVTVNATCAAEDCSAAGKRDEGFGKVTIEGVSVFPMSKIVVGKAPKKRAAPDSGDEQRKAAKADTE